MNLRITPNFNTNQMQSNKTKQNQSFGATPYTISSHLRPKAQEIMASHEVAGALAVLEKRLAGGYFDRNKDLLGVHVQGMYVEDARALMVSVLKKLKGGGILGSTMRIPAQMLESANDSNAVRKLFEHVEADEAVMA